MCVVCCLCPKLCYGCVVFFGVCVFFVALVCLRFGLLICFLFYISVFCCVVFLACFVRLCLLLLCFRCLCVCGLSVFLSLPRCSYVLFRCLLRVLFDCVVLFCCFCFCVCLPFDLFQGFAVV